MGTLPTVETRDQYRERFIKEHGGTFEKAFPALMLESMFGRYGKLPRSGSQDEVEQEALQSIKNMEFGDMGDYISTLVQIADHYQELAESYAEELIYCGYTFDIDGSVNDPGERDEKLGELLWQANQRKKELEKQ